MKTFWLRGETQVENNGLEEYREQANEDEGIDDIEEITFTFHVSDHDEQNCHKF